jgi:hypothetical protein
MVFPDFTGSRLVLDLSLWVVAACRWKP